MTTYDSIVERLIAIWRELLDTPAVGPDDDFYDLGGYSIFVLRMSSRAAGEFGVEITVDDVFTFRTPAALGQHIFALLRESDAEVPTR
jgi:nonribosomal peptide synthetase DhbF